MNRTSQLLAFLLVLAVAAAALTAYRGIGYRRDANKYLQQYIQLSDSLGAESVFADENIALRSDSIVPGRMVFFGTQAIAHWDMATDFPEFETINRGVSGQRVSGYLLRFRQDVVDLRPEYVVIEISSYNFRPLHSIGSILAYVHDMVDIAERNEIRPIVSTIIPPTDTAQVEVYQGYHVLDSLDQFNRALRRMAADRSICLADWNLVLSDDRRMMPDSLAANRVEPNRRGYTLLAAEVRKCLSTAR